MEQKELIKYHEEKRTELVKMLNEERSKGRDLQNVFIFAYITFQHVFAESMMGEDARLTEEQLSTLKEIDIRIASFSEDLWLDFKSMCDSDQKDLFPIIMNVVRAFDQNTDEKEDDGLYIDVDNNTIYKYLAGAVAAIIRIMAEPVTEDELLSYIQNDELGKFTIDACNPEQSYKWIEEHFDVPCSDIILFFDNAKDIRDKGLSDEEKEQVKDVVDAMRKMMRKVAPIFCGSTLSGCKTDEEQAEFKALMNSMFETHEQPLATMFSIGFTFYALMPKETDMLEKMKDHESCVSFFNATYETMCGTPVKDFYEPLSDAEKNVARTIFLAGLISAHTSAELNDGEGWFGISQGAAYGG